MNKIVGEDIIHPFPTMFCCFLYGYSRGDVDIAPYFMTTESWHHYDEANALALLIEDVYLEFMLVYDGFGYGKSKSVAAC